MKWRWHLCNTGYIYGSSSYGAIREATRALCIAECLHRMGEQVEIRSLPQSMPKKKPNRTKFFSHLFGASMSVPDIVVVEAEFFTFQNQKHRPRRSTLVGFKTSKALRDIELLPKFQYLLAHEYKPNISSPKLIPLSYIVFDSLLDVFLDRGLLSAYLDNDLAAIRDAFLTPHTGKVGFTGTALNGRSNLINRLMRATQNADLFDIRFTRGTGFPILYGSEYLEWLSGLAAGIHLAGDSPKATRFAELALMGIPIVMVPCSMVEQPPVTKQNTILLDNWKDAISLLDGLEQTGSIQQAADEAYLSGWSPMGQAKQILKRVGSHGR